MPPENGPPEPWRSFFDDLDKLLSEPIQLRCFGGFAVIYAFGVARTTNDCDFVSVIPYPSLKRVSEFGGEGSDLHIRHHVYLHQVTVATPPESYEDRLIPLFPGLWKRVELFALEAHDLALAKLERNFDRDRDDVQRLARAGHLKPDVLGERYEKELRPLLSREKWHDGTLRMWIESYWPEYVLAIQDADGPLFDDNT
jgi:hypothetical protein